jgi:hypothetical protein
VAGTPSQGGPEPDPRLDDLVEGRRVAESEDEMSTLLAVEALRAPARAGELGRLDADVSAFAAARREAQAEKGAAVVVPLAPRRHRPAALAAAAVAGVTASVLLVGTAAAAITGSLPDPLQRIAHDLVGAPAPSTDQPGGDDETTGAASTTAQGPAATSGAPAVVGLCRAFGQKASLPPSGSTAYAALEKAAAAKGVTVAEYCAGVLAAVPSTPPGQTTKPTTPPGQTKKPTTPPGQTKKPTAPPGQTKKPTAPPGQTKKPTAPPGSTKKPSTPPGQSGKPSAPPGQTKSPGKP